MNKSTVLTISSSVPEIDLKVNKNNHLEIMGLAWFDELICICSSAGAGLDG